MKLEYQIPYNKKIEQAINYAKMHENIRFSKAEISKWKNEKLLFPIPKLEHIFEINKKYINIPVQYQNIWFCLHDCQVIRQLASGRIIKPKVSFASIYVEQTDNIIDLIKNAIDKIGSRKRFAELVCFDVASLNEWLTEKRPRKSPVFAIMKACQILNKNVWKILNGVKLYGTSGKNFIIFNYNYPSEINDIRIWIENEGTLALNSTEITFKQNESGLNALKKLGNLFYKIFNINSSIVFDSGSKSYLLRIISSPIRQILCLQYNIPLGYSTYSNASNDIFEFSYSEEGYRRLAKNLETEGCFGIRRKRKFNYIYASFGSSNKTRRDKFTEMTQKLDFKFKNYDQKTVRNYHSRLLSNKDIIRLLFNILPYFWHDGKVRNIFVNRNSEILLQKRFMLFLRFDVNDGIKKLIQESIRKYGSVKRLNLFLLQKAQNFEYKHTHNMIYHWLKNKSKIPLIIIISLCDLFNRNYFDYVPDYCALILWVHGFISYHKLEEIRNTKFGSLDVIFKKLSN